MAEAVGSLFVHLGLDSAKFQAGLAKASSGLNNFASMAGKGMVALAAASTAAAGALAYAVKGAIDNADEMGEMAQKVGVSVEALSSLSWAAKLSGTDTETLAASLRKLSANMLAVAQGSTGPVATAFKAMGISVKDAAGNLKSSEAVLMEIADKFAQLKDGSTETALAMQLFGKSGAELVPFLNQGRDGIEELRAEADRLGITISSDMADAAGEFNDALDRLRAGLQGMVNRVTSAALPALNSLVNTLTSPDFQTAMKDFAIACIEIANGIAQVFIGAHKAFKDFMSFIGAGPPPEGEQGAQYDEKGMWGTWKNSEDGTRVYNEINRAMEWMNNGKGKPSADDLYAGFGFNSDGTIRIQETQTAVDELTASFDGLFSGGGGGATAGAKELNAALEEGKAIFEATRTPAEAYAIQIEHLNDLLAKGAINQDTYTRAVVQAQEELDEANSKASDLAETIGKDIGGALSGLFDSSKSVAEKVLDIAGAVAPLLFPGKDGKDGIGKAISDFISGLPGFQEGGSFKVGGAGALDSQVAMMRLSPGENVSITKPGQEQSRTSQLVEVLVHPSGEFDSRVERTAGPVAARVSNAGDARAKRDLQRNAGQVNRTWSSLRG